MTRTLNSIDIRQSIEIREDYDVAVALNYYAPYVSGLTETARILAEKLAERGYKVAVAATRHEPDLPEFETIEGVDVYRAPVLMKIGRGPVSPSYPKLVKDLADRSGALHLHLPMLEAGLIARMVKDTPIVSTYHIDLWLAPSLTSPIQIAAVNASARAAIAASDHVVVNSEDQIVESVVRDDILARPWSGIPAPCLDPRGGSPSLRMSGGTHYGFLGRIVPDKGVEYLIEAFRRIASSDDTLLLGGEIATVAGGSNIDKLNEVAGGDERIHFLGQLDRPRMKDFFASIDVFALTSVAESFGIVQAEAMMCGIPVVGSNLPGGRVPIEQTGFGILCEPRDVDAISDALLDVRAFTEEERAEKAKLAHRLYGVEACVDGYAGIFDALNGKAASEPTALAA